MRVLTYGTYDVRTHPRVAVLIQGLREHGDEVEEVNVPLGISTASRVAMLRQPWRLPLLALRLLRCWTVLAVRGRRARRALRPDAVLVGYMGHFDVRLARLVFGRRATIALDHLIFAADTARDRGVNSSWKARLLRWLDRQAMRRADLVLLDTAEHAELMPEEFADRGVVVPVGAPADWFAAGQAAADRPHPADRPLRAVFFGLFTPLQGTPTLGAALRLLADEPGIQVLMIGRGQDLAAAREAAEGNGNVEWREWVPAAELPALVADHDVCLGIFGTGPKALRVTPNKVFQGAAAGCAVITSDTPPQRAAMGEAAYYVPPGDAEALATALRKLAADTGELDRLRAAARDRAVTTFSAGAVIRPVRDRLAARRERP